MRYRIINHNDFPVDVRIIPVGQGGILGSIPQSDRIPQPLNPLNNEYGIKLDPLIQISCAGAADFAGALVISDPLSGKTESPVADDVEFGTGDELTNALADLGFTIHRFEEWVPPLG